MIMHDNKTAMQKQSKVLDPAVSGRMPNPSDLQAGPTALKQLTQSLYYTIHIRKMASLNRFLNIAASITIQNNLPKETPLLWNF